MRSASTNRFEWLKAVTQCSQVPTIAKVIATALSIQFANEETGQINPSVPTLAAYVNTSTDTIKRGIKALIAAGWLSRSEGRGRGNRTCYTLCSPGKVVSISAPKKGRSDAPSREEKGAKLHGKGGKAAPFHYKDKQSFEQKGAPTDQFRHVTFHGNNYSGPVIVNATDTSALYAWGRWLKRQGLRALESYPVKRSGKKANVFFFVLPWKTPPESDDEAAYQQALDYFEALSEQEVA